LTSVRGLEDFKATNGFEWRTEASLALNSASSFAFQKSSSTCK